MKIPQYRSTEPLSARQPPQVNPSVYSLPARAGIGLGEAISGAGNILMDQEIKIKEGKRKVEQTLALQSGIDEYRTRMDDFGLNLQKMPDKSGYADQLRKGSTEIQNDIFKKIKDTKVQDVLKIKFSDLGTDYYIKARDYENKYFISTKTGEALEKLDSISKRAGMAPSIEETIRVGSEGIRLIDGLTGTAFSPEEASKMKIKLSDDIEKEGLKTRSSNARLEISLAPDKADEIIEKYSIPVDKSLPLLEHARARMNQLEAEKRRKETDSGKELDKNKSNLKTKIDLAIMAGQDWMPLLEAGKLSGIVDESVIQNSVTFQKSWNDAQKRIDREENPIVKNDLILGLYGSKITKSETDLRNALDSGDINTQTFQTFLTHRTSRLEGLETKGLTRLDRTFEHNEKILGMKMATEGPAAQFIDREAKDLHAEGLREMFGLVYDPKNPIDPDLALDKIINRYGTVLEGIKDRESKKLRKTLVIPNKETASIYDMAVWLEANEKKMPKATFEAQIRMIRAIEWLEVPKAVEKEMESIKNPKAEKKPVKKVK